MVFSFTKYQGTGNDFVLIDQRESTYLTAIDQETIAQICHRRFGVGADGLMLLELADGYDFRMVYFNSDGRPSTFCGNGGRCIVAFAKELGLIRNEAYFLATDGPHRARVLPDGRVALQMQNVPSVEQLEDHYQLDTGSPHYVQFVADLDQVDIFAQGRSIRNSAPFRTEGINVNFVEITAKLLKVATYERGVEAETYSCGTGVTAAALAFARKQQLEKGEVAIQTKGGNLAVRYEQLSDGAFRSIELIGPAVRVFAGEWGN